MEVLLVVLGAVIAGAVSWGNELLRDKHQRQASERQQRRQVVDLYLPHSLDLLVALQWLDHDLKRQLGQVMHDNPYPSLPHDIKVPGHWYSHMLRLAHHPLMPDEVRSAAKGVVDESERWNAVVEDLDSAVDVADTLISGTRELINALEAATH